MESCLAIWLTSLVLNCCNKVILPVMIVTVRFISWCLSTRPCQHLPADSLHSWATWTFPSHFCIESRTKPGFSIREALQQRRNTEPQEARHPCKHSNKDLLCCQERMECTQKEDEPVWLASALNLELNWWLSRFMLEIRRHDGKEYPVNTWYQICYGILRYIWELNWISFVMLHLLVFIKISMLKWSGGLGVHTKQGEPITRDEEELFLEHFGVSLWNIFCSQRYERTLTLETALVECTSEVPYIVYWESVLLLQVT